MTNNSGHAIELFDLMTKLEAGDATPLQNYLSAEPTRAATADFKDLLLVRNQYGSTHGGRWQPYSAQPHENPWPGTPSRQALALMRCDIPGNRRWFELTLPYDMHICRIIGDGDAFCLQVDSDALFLTGDQILRVIADCAFGPPGFSEAEIARGFEKLFGRVPLDVVGPRDPAEVLGAALPLVLKDPDLGWFKFSELRPASYSQAWEDGPRHTLLADPSGRFDAALARARTVLPALQNLIAAGTLITKATKPDFGVSDEPRISTSFSHDGTVRLTIDDSAEGTTCADLVLDADDALRLDDIYEVAE